MNKAILIAVMAMVMAAVTVEAQFVESPVVTDPAVVVTPVIEPVVTVAKTAPVREPKLTKAPSEPNFYVGAYGIYTFEGDIETPSPGVGVQTGLYLLDTVRVGVSLTDWSDEMEDTEMEVVSFGATVYWGPEILKGVYFGVGASLNQIEMEVNLPNISVEVRDSTGIHGVIGFEKNIFRGLSLFTEVKYHDRNTTATISSDCDPLVVEGTLNNYELGLGFNWSF